MVAVDITYDPALPITNHIGQIADLISAHQVVVIAGDTGSGKTTQIPKICYQLGRKRIGHTQPRRIAARSVAQRIAAELKTSLGEYVGYQVRFSKKVTRSTAIKVMTDGILLAEISHDRDLRRYDTIIIDEAHERSLTIDFLLGYLKSLLKRRKDLKVIITSATIDTQRFSDYFDQAPIVQVEGRTYPVEIRYRDESIDSQDQPEAIADAVDELMGEGVGDILVFCPGERQIHEAIDALSQRHYDCEILPLHSRLNAQSQQRIFEPHSQRRIIVSTNIAETSVTVPSIRYVVDTGQARISRYSARTKVQRLPIEVISQASANQRAGRCGRLGPGICIRLYSEEDFLSRPIYTDPEIKRTNLASVLLAMAHARLGAIEDFGFIDPPDPAHIRDAKRLLTELHALKTTSARSQGDVVLSKIGSTIAAFPIDPRLSRMVIEAHRRSVLKPILTIVSFLSIQDIRERPEQADQADQLHRRFFTDSALEKAIDSLHGKKDSISPQVSPGESAVATWSHQPARHTVHTSKSLRYAMNHGGEENIDPAGDIAVILRLWSYLDAIRTRESHNQMRKRCIREYLNYRRYREWCDLRSQLEQICRDLSMDPDSSSGSEDDILICVLSGLLSHIGVQITRPHSGKKRKNSTSITEYMGARSSRFSIQPGSVLAKRHVQMVMAVEMVDTTRLWARHCAAIDATWVEQLAGDLLKRSYSPAQWSQSTSSVIAYERSTLYGVPIRCDHRVNYARIDPVVAREIFIREALVGGRWKPRRAFVRDLCEKNRSMIEQAEELADRSRASSLLIDDEAIFRFYDRLLPSHVVSGASCEKWLSTLDDPSQFTIEMDIFASPDQIHATREDFPDRFQAEDSYPIDYIFEPGHERDGACVHLPLEALNRLSPQLFSWHVPGMRRQRAIALMRTLPKEVRTSFVPIPDHADKALQWLEDNGEDHHRFFWQELARALRAISGITVDDSCWQPEKIPDYLHMGYIVHDGDRRYFGKDLEKLKSDLMMRMRDAITSASTDSVRARSWVFGTIDPHVDVVTKQTRTIGYPALTDQGDSVRLILTESQQVQQMTHRWGVRRLLTLTNPDPSRWVLAHLSARDKLALSASCYGNLEALLADARLKAVERCANKSLGLDIYDESSYEKLAVDVRQEQADTMRQIVAISAEISRLHMDLKALSTTQIGQEIYQHTCDLVFDGYIAFIRDPWFDQIPRYLKAAGERIKMSMNDPQREARLGEMIDNLWDSYDDLTSSFPEGRLPDEVDDIAFMIEELTVQTFAQRLGTYQTVSAKRIHAAIERCR